MSPRLQRSLLQGGAAIVGITLLALAMWLYELLPKVEADTMKPIRSEGSIGTAVENPVFSVRVESVQVARSMATYSRQVRTDGVFLIVRARARAERKPVTMGRVTLESRDGQIYRSSPRIGLNDSFLEKFEPLLWGPVTAVFELPADQLAGSRFVLVEGGRPSTQLAAATSVDLGITRTRAVELISQALENYRLERS